MMDALKWVPIRFSTWFFEADQRPGMVKLREHRAHVREVAVNLIKEKKQELKDGTSRKDVMTLLGSSCVIFMGFDTRYNTGPSVKANASLKVDWRLNDKELVAQVR